jgi:hypothetical protein
MKRTRYFIIFLLIILSLLMLSACAPSQEEKIQGYLDEQTSYGITSEFDNGVLNIKILMSDEENTWNENGERAVQSESKLLLQAVKAFPREEPDLFSQVNLLFMTDETNKIVAEIHVEGSALLETDWTVLDPNEVPQYVDAYSFYGNPASQ